VPSIDKDTTGDTCFSSSDGVQAATNHTVHKGNGGWLTVNGHTVSLQEGRVVLFDGLFVRTTVVFVNTEQTFVIWLPSLLLIIVVFYDICLFVVD
jgi:hypothetical protein